jgi:predicted enzyme related to lactoylglutathione lyase
MRLTLPSFVALGAVALATLAAAAPVSANPQLALSAQYDTTHVYVAVADFDRFVAAILATFGGTASKKVSTVITPTPSRSFSQLVLTPVGSFSIFAFETPIPYPFGSERTGYLVTDLDRAVTAARALGAAVIVAPFNDPIGRDSVIQWPGGVNMQLYSHVTRPSYPPLSFNPENRIYVSPEKADEFVACFVAFARGTISSDEPHASGADVGRPGVPFRRVRIESGFGRIAVLVTDGHLPYPYGRELTGYAVADLDTTLAKAKSAGGTVLIGPYRADSRDAAMVRFPGGYIAEIHAPAR